MKNQILKTALIAGASGRIGSAVARDLASKSYHLILMDINEETNRTLAQELPSAEIITLDLTDREELRAICKLIPHYNLDVAFINTGMVHPGDILNIPMDAIDLQLEDNLRSTIMLNKACGEALKEKGGSIINTVFPDDFMRMKSSAAKFGLRGFLRSFHSEMKPHGIHVSGLYPAAVNTGILKKAALNDRSDLNFPNKPSSVDALVKGFNRALNSGKLEIYIPQDDSIISGFLGKHFPVLLMSYIPSLRRLETKGNHGI